MNRLLATLLVVVFLAVDASGCAGKAAPKASPSSTEPPPLVPPDADYGAIEGFVIDTERIPRDNVTVTLVGANKTALTDATGYFLFLPLDPGAYHVQVNASLYVAIHRNVTVPMGDSLRTDFTLVRIPNPEPYIDAGYTHTGQIQCQFRANATNTNTNPSCSDTPLSGTTGDYLPPSRGANITMLPGVGGLVIEVQWTAAFPLVNDKLRLAIYPTQGIAAWRQIESPSVLKYVIDANGMKDLERSSERNYTKEGGALYFSLYPGEAANQASVGGAGGTFQQSYTMYVTVFYREAPTPGYTRLK